MAIGEHIHRSSALALNTDLQPLPEIPQREGAGLWDTATRFGTSLLKVALLVSLVITLASFLVPNKYRSTATLLPEDTQAGSSILAALSSVANLVGAPVSGYEKLYPTIV